jgi:probable rRNA maturation factor
MVLVQITKQFRGIDASVRKLKRLIRSICSRFDISEATIDVAIVDDARIRTVNSQFLNRNSSTDCLSFDLSEGRERSFELIVNGELAVKEARLRGHSGEAELALYVTHGMLHNLGFDDSTRRQAKEMHHTEDKILQEFGYGIVYHKTATGQKCRGEKA